MKVATISIAVAVLALGTYGWFDTAPYRLAKRAYEVAARDRLPSLQLQLKHEEEWYRQCDTMRVESPVTRTIDLTGQGRQCLIAALGQTYSVPGALVLSRNAAVALAKNPQDRQLRAAALGAIGNARQALARHKPWLYDRLEQLNHAYAGSVVLRLLLRPDLRPVTFDSQAALLDQAEHAIHLPQVYQAQQIWRLQALLPVAQAGGAAI